MRLLNSELRHSSEMPNARPKLVVNDPMLRPTVTQMSATERSVLRSSAAACSSRRVGRYWCGVSPEGPPELAAEVRCGEAGGACECGDVEQLPVAGDRILGAEEMAGRRHWSHRLSIAAARRVTLAG
jgi:hypothetical protein